MANAKARHTDPESSHLAADDMNRSGARDTQAEAVLDAVYRWPGRTAKEIASATGMDRYAVSRRLPELEQDGLVARGDQRRCHIGGRQSVTWWADLGGQGELF